MGKSGFYLYGVSGKVGNIVARKGENGKTVLVAYQPNVKNPQTNLQMAQRIILATVAQAIQQLNPIIDHSFEGFAVGSKCIREFRRLNMNLLRQYAAQDFNETPKPADATCFMTTKGIKALIPNKYQISSGSLSPTRLNIVRRTNNDVRELEVVLPTLSVPVSFDDEGQYVTLRDIMLKLFGISGNGEQLTFVAIQRSGDGYKFVFANNDRMPGWVIPYTSMRAARLVIGADVDLNKKYYIPEEPAAGDLDGIWSAITTDILLAFQMSPKTDNSLWAFVKNFFDAMDITDTFVDGVFKVEFEHGLMVDNWTRDVETGLGHCYALGIIRSKLADNGKWQYSNTFMKTCALAVDEYNYGLEWNSAIQAWFQTNEVAANELFLKEGTDQNERGEAYNVTSAEPIPLSINPPLPIKTGKGGIVSLVQPISEEELLAGELKFYLTGNTQATVVSSEDTLYIQENGDSFWTVSFADSKTLVIQPVTNAGPDIIRIER